MTISEIQTKVNELNNAIEEFMSGNEHLLERINATDLSNVDEIFRNINAELGVFEAAKKEEMEEQNSENI
jgi:hypothetical protein